MKNKLKKQLNKPAVWIGTTYFAEGFPYSIIRQVSSLFFRTKNVSLEMIGLTSLFGIPWILKFLWGPQIDRYGTKRRWLLLMEFIFSLLIFGSALFAPFSWGIPIIGILFFMGSIIAATHDIAIDGYYMESLNNEDQEKFIGYRILAYRIALMVGTGVIVTIGTNFSWFLAFLTCAAIFLLLFLFHYKMLPEKETNRYPISLFLRHFTKPKPILITTMIASGAVGLRFLLTSSLYQNLGKHFIIFKKMGYAHWISIILLLGLVTLFLMKGYIKRKISRNKDSFYARSFLVFMDRKKIGVALAFVILIRTGEFLLHAMVPTFIVDIGLKTHYGWISAVVGLPASIIGALVGGWLISKYGFKKMVWPLLLIQNITNLLYMFVAYDLESFLKINTGQKNTIFIGWDNTIMVASVNGFEQFSAGLGTAILTVYLLKLCMPKYKTTHFAIGTGVMSITGAIAGIAGGFLTGAFGYGTFFGMSFVLAIPGMLLIPYIPHFDYSKES